MSENHMDLTKGEPGPCSETRVMSTHGGNELTGIKVEMVTGMSDEEDQEPTTVPVTKTQPNISCMSVNSMDLTRGELGPYSEQCAMSARAGNEFTFVNVECIPDMTEECDHDPMKIPVIKTEPKDCMDFLQVELSPCSETSSVTSTHGDNELTRIKVERVSDVSDDEDQEPTTIPVIKKEPKNRVDLMKGELGPCSQPCAMSTHRGNAFAFVNVESIPDMTEEGGQDPMKIPVIKKEPKNCVDCEEDGTGSCSETCVKRDVDGTEKIFIKQEAIDIEDDIPEVITSSFNPEHEGTSNEQIHVHTTECKYPCGIRRAERPYKCEMCKKVFTQQRNLIRHQRIHSGERPYTCDVCNKSFSMKGNLITHQRIHSGERPYICNVCNKSFSVKSNLKTHQRIHSGERPYTCKVCNKSFSIKSNLIAHQRIHSGERLYTCEVCNMEYSQQSDLITHRRIHSGESPHTCEMCNKTFSSKSTLLIHQNIHSGENLYACELCHRAFSRKYSLMKHHNIHTGERPYACTVCNKAFSRPSSLMRHRYVHSDERPYTEKCVLQGIHTEEQSDNTETPT